MSYSAKSTGVPLNELVSITSQPTSRKAVCTFSTASGRVISKMLVTAFKPQAAKVLQRQVLYLEICAHGAVKDDDTFLQSVEKVSHFRLPIVASCYRVSILIHSEMINRSMRKPRAVTTRGLRQNL